MITSDRQRHINRDCKQKRRKRSTSKTEDEIRRYYKLEGVYIYEPSTENLIVKINKISD